LQRGHKGLSHAGQRFFDEITPINDDINNQPAVVCRNKKSTSFTAPVASSISIHKK